MKTFFWKPFDVEDLPNMVDRAIKLKDEEFGEITGAFIEDDGEYIYIEIGEGQLIQYERDEYLLPTTKLFVAEPLENL